MILRRNYYIKTSVFVLLRKADQLDALLALIFAHLADHLDGVDLVAALWGLERGYLGHVDGAAEERTDLFGPALVVVLRPHEVDLVGLGLVFLGEVAADVDAGRFEDYGGVVGVGLWLGFVLEDIGDLGLLEVLALGLRVFEVVVGGEVAVAVVDVGLALALYGVGTRIFVVGVVVLGLALGRCSYFDLGLGLLLVVREVRSDPILEVGMVGEIQMPSGCSGHFFFNFPLTVSIAILEIQAIRLIILPLLLVDGRSHSIVRIILFVLNRNREGVRLDLVIDLIRYDMHLIQDCFEIALRLMFAILTARKLPGYVILEILLNEYLRHLASIILLDGLYQIEGGVRVLLTSVLLYPLGLEHRLSVLA